MSSRSSGDSVSFDELCCRGGIVVTSAVLLSGAELCRLGSGSADTDAFPRACRFDALKMLPIGSLPSFMVIDCACANVWA